MWQNAAEFGRMCVEYDQDLKPLPYKPVYRSVTANMADWDL